MKLFIEIRGMNEKGREIGEMLEKRDGGLKSMSTVIMNWRKLE